MLCISLQRFAQHDSPILDELLTYSIGHCDFKDAMSIEKRYFTSDLSSLSYASLTFWIGMTSISAVMLCLPQKSSISCVSAMPPIIEPERLRRLGMRPNAGTRKGSAGAPTSVRL